MISKLVKFSLFWIFTSTGCNSKLIIIVLFLNSTLQR
nr:MAG TPA: hypothetical protein [Caudoviricetes sp.]